MAGSVAGWVDGDVGYHGDVDGVVAGGGVCAGAAGGADGDAGVVCDGVVTVPTVVLATTPQGVSYVRAAGRMWARSIRR